MFLHLYPCPTEEELSIYVSPTLPLRGGGGAESYVTLTLPQKVRELSVYESLTPP